MEYLEEIGRAAMHMVEAMEDLLVLARVGHVERPEAPLEVREVVDEVLHRLATPLSSASVTVEVGTLPQLRVPRTQLAQLYDNLVGNALRYGCPGSGCIELGGTRRGALVDLYVRDHGPGIPPAEHERIFELFYRGASGSATKGTGIGLATVQKIARLYAGRAWVETTPGGGSTFHVELHDPPGAAG